jgi:hypothetical protein
VRRTGVRAILFRVTPAEPLRHQPAVGPMGDNDPIATEFCRKEGIGLDELFQHLSMETVQLTWSLTGPFYEWADGVDKRSARAALRTAETLSRQPVGEDDTGSRMRVATGEALDRIVSVTGLQRARGETDRSLRQRALVRMKQR